MSNILATPSILSFALNKAFASNLGHAVYLDLYTGTKPTKTELEDSNIYKDDGTGWIDPEKWDAFISVQGMDIIRRFALDDFSSNTLIADNIVTFGFGDRDKSSYQKSSHANNVFNAGQITWFAIRSMSADFATHHYTFTGTVSDMDGSGELRLSKSTVSQVDLIFPSNVSIDIGNLLVM